MKTKNYEKTELIIFITTIFLILEIIGIICLVKKKEYTYQKVSGIVSGKNLVTVIVNNKERKYFYQNQTLFLNNKNTKYSIKEDRGKLLKKKNKVYYELLVNIKLSKKIKSTDVVDLSIKKEKRSLFKILKKIWEGG